jgi:hypothetical protein
VVRSRSKWIDAEAKDYNSKEFSSQSANRGDSMRRLCLVTLLAFIASGPLRFLTLRADEGAEKVAQKAALAWLALVDAGGYGESWEQSCELFKKHISKEQWAKTAEAVRSPLGKLESRRLVSSQYRTTLPGAPDGEYVVIQFQSSFERKKSAIETVTPMKEKDGQWRVSGYQIK